MEGHLARCKIVVVGDTQCGKTALLHVFAKDCYPESYVPTVFENYTASFEIDKQRTELNMWDTSGSAYYDNVRPLAYPDSDAVLICFDISRPETLDSVLKKWQGETQEFCPNAKIVLVGCKLDMRTDLNTLRELSKQRLIPVTHEQRAGTADWGSGLCRMLLQGVREQREGRVPPDHAGLGQQGAQEPETQQLQAGTEAGVTDAWQDRLPE
ncbi:rho-related GTP-binding protein RhoN isoform X2 [Ammospiza caudacuta]|uniref:rho-related GTP-binding protein RhoN isoform X2 n=1 Tax=Ammospiza caudacuta TaxID=2857398 RepID=UPI002738B49C|nr:rho-related GTP-binding protein RhoN isoform X2 [Ammospiza caudacuta]